MKKKVLSKLSLSKETLQNMTDLDLEKAEGAGTTQSLSQQQGSCPYTWRCCY